MSKFFGAPQVIKVGCQCCARYVKDTENESNSQPSLLVYRDVVQDAVKESCSALYLAELLLRCLQDVRAEFLRLMAVAPDVCDKLLTHRCAWYVKYG